MNNRTFTQDLLGVQNDLLRFAYKLTSDREEYQRPASRDIPESSGQ